MRKQPLLITALLMFTAACGSSSDSSGSSTESAGTVESVDETDAASTEPAGEAPAVAGGAGAYISLADYQASKDSYASSKVVLFFNATWCSTCKKARGNLEADLSAIPSDLAIVLVDFDSETDLKRQYGVTVQHTFVQVDADGNELAKWSGSLTAQEIAENTV
jgi:thiol-disulfide isomerase/thioredoxin